MSDDSMLTADGFASDAINLTSIRASAGTCVDHVVTLRVICVFASYSLGCAG